MSRETHKRVEVAIRVVRSKDDKVPDGFAAMHEDGTIESKKLFPTESLVFGYVFRLISKFIIRGAMPIDSYTTEGNQS